MKKSITLFCSLVLLLGAAKGQIRILQVDPLTDEISIKNFGASMEDISDYRLCSRFGYTQNLTSAVTTLSGSPMLMGGDTLVVSWPIDDVSADVGLYLAAGSFGSADAMVDFMQYGGAGIGRESVANTKTIWTTGDFIAGDGPYTYTGNGTENGAGFWEAAPAAEASMIRFLQVNPATDAIYIKNFGDSEVDISAYRLCSEFNYTRNLTSDIMLISGSATLAAGDTLAVSWPVTDEAADLGLYLAEGSFSDTSAMIDFLQWGAGGIGRESVADSKGIWTAGEFIAGEGPYTYTGDGSNFGLELWETTLIEPLEGLVGFLKVDPATDAIYIKNFGEAEVDIAAYRLCSEFRYTGNLTTDITLISGSTTLAAGDTLAVTWPITDEAADLGLYLAEGAFGDTSAIVDFLQWGAAGIGRESVADSKGIWTAGEFIEGNGPYTYTGSGTESGLAFWTTDTMLTDIDPALRRLIDVSVFPSPAVDHTQLRIQLPVSGTIQVNLLDGMGRRLSHEAFPGIPGLQERRVDLDGLASGLYYVQVLLDDNLITVSHVIKR